MTYPWVSLGAAFNLCRYKRRSSRAARPPLPAHQAVVAADASGNESRQRTLIECPIQGAVVGFSFRACTQPCSPKTMRAQGQSGRRPSYVKLTTSESMPSARWMLGRGKSSCAGNQRGRRRRCHQDDVVGHVAGCFSCRGTSILSPIPLGYVSGDIDAFVEFLHLCHDEHRPKSKKRQLPFQSSNI